MAGVREWRRELCLGCGGIVKRQRDTWIEAVGTADGTWCCFLEVAPRIALGDPPESRPDARVLRLGVLHAECQQAAFERIKAGSLVVSEDAVEYEIDSPSEDESIQSPAEPTGPGHCPFCQAGDDPRADFTDEDIYPKWLLKVYAEKGAVAVVDGIRKRKFRGATVRVCGNCNNNWMSVLEQDTRDLILALSNNYLTLDHIALKKLALWAGEKAILFDVALGEPAVPSGFGHDLRIRKDPPPGVHVWVAAYSHSRLIYDRWIISSEHGEPLGVAITFSMARVIFQVLFSIVQGDWPEPDSLAGSVLRIWPIADATAMEPLEWPPPLYLDITGANALVERVRSGLREPVKMNANRPLCVCIRRDDGMEEHLWLDMADVEKAGPLLGHIG
jgi:hypothetical protein